MVKRKGKHLSLLLSHRLSTMKNDVCLGSLWERIFDISGRVLFLSKRDCLIKGEKRVFVIPRCLPRFLSYFHIRCCYVTTSNLFDKFIEIYLHVRKEIFIFCVKKFWDIIKIIEKVNDKYGSKELLSW